MSRHPAGRATRRRVEATRQRALEALAAIGDGAVSVAALAQAAGVSRSWIYTQPDLLEQIHQRGRSRAAGRGERGASSQRASSASLRRRLELAQERIRELAADNEQLRDELARAYGQLRRRND